MTNKPIIVDNSGELLDYQDETGLEAIQSIVPYFPDDERMANYLCYVSSGWTRTQSLRRAGATKDDLELWRQDSKFLELDSLGYSELRKEVANAYAERLTRKNVVQLLEFDSELFETVRDRINAGEELTKDERAFALKRAGMYGIETLNTLQKLLNPNIVDDSQLSDGAFDIMAFVMRRRSG